jgi:hypothetical protein
MAEQLNLTLKPFDVNEGVDDKNPNGIARLANVSPSDAFDIETYSQYWTYLSKSTDGINNLIKAFGPTSSIPPSINTFAKITYMPNAQTQNIGVLQWPGLPPEVLEKMAREHVGPQLIISNRVDQVLKYSELSTHPWRPGWKVVPRDPEEIPDAKTKRDIREAESFILNSGIGEDFEDPRRRDQIFHTDFTRFLAELVRNTLTFDGIAIWTDMEEGTVHNYALLPAQNIRLLARPDKPITVMNQGELDFTGTHTTGTEDARSHQFTMDHFAVAVDESGNIVNKFTRNDLIWYTRNPRVDASIAGYGLPEMEAALTLVTGFTNAINFNADIFDKNSIPKGILALKGNFTQRQLDALGRVWDNLQRGARTDWTLPAIQISEGGSIEVISLEALRSESAYYAHLVNLFMGALATIYRFPPHKLGYKISGTERDPRPDIAKSMMDEDDTGLPIILTHIENIFNTYLLGLWPHLKLVFTGKSPKEDSRLYEAKTLSMTWGEKRQAVGLRPLAETVTSSAAKEMAELLDMAPTDPGLVGIYQSLIMAKSKMMGGSILEGPPEGEGGSGTKGKTDMPGSRFNSKIDPARSEQHGGVSGVRRDSRAEKKKVPSLNSGGVRNPPVDKT